MKRSLLDLAYTKKYLYLGRVGTNSPKYIGSQTTILNQLKEFWRPSLPANEKKSKMISKYPLKETVVWYQ